MSAKPPPRREPGKAPGLSPTEQRAIPPKRGSLQWVRDVLTRSIRLEQRKNQLHVVLVDTKRGPAASDAPLTLLQQQRAELGARLLVHDPLTQTVRHLFAVHDELGKSGWLGVERLAPKVIGLALVEAEILIDQEPSTLLGGIIDRLRALKAAAQAKAQQEAREQLMRELESAPAPEVSEASHEEFELMERSWVGTFPQAIEPPERAA